MTDHSSSAALPADLVAIVASATKHMKAGEVAPPSELAIYQASAIDALLQEAAALTTIQVSSGIRGEVRAMVNTVRRNFVDRYLLPGADLEAGAAGRSFGLMAAIAEVGVRLGVFPWETGEIYRAAGSMFDAWQKPDGSGQICKPPAPMLDQSVVSVEIEPSAPEVSPDADAGTCQPVKQPPPKNSLSSALDGIGRPDAVTIARVIEFASPIDDNLCALLTDHRHRRTIPLRFAECGYERVRNADATDGLWSTRSGKRVPVYARIDRSDADRQAAVRHLLDTSATVQSTDR